MNATIEPRQPLQQDWDAHSPLAKIAVDLARIQFLQFGDLTTTRHDVQPDAPRVPICIEPTRLLLYPDVTADLAFMVEHEVRLTPCQSIVSASEAMEQVAAAIAMRLRLRSFTVTPHTMAVPFTQSPHTRVTIIDAVLGNGSAPHVVMQRLQDAGYTVGNLVTLLDLEQGGREWLAREHPSMHCRTLCSIAQALDHCIEAGQLLPRDAERILQYLHTASRAVS